MLKRLTFLALVVLVLGARPNRAIGDVTFEVIPVPQGDFAFASTSGDGAVTAVNVGGHYYRFTESGVEDLGFGHEFSWSTGIAGDGSALIGTQVDEGTGWRNPAIWRPGDGWTLLGPVPGGLECDNSLGSGYAMDDYGTAACGLAWSAELCKAVGFLWTEEGGMVALDRDTPWSCRASDISGDGRTVVGFGDHPQFGTRGPVRWVDGGPIDRFLGPDAAGECNGVNSDGTIICGTIDFGSGMIWTEADGLTVVPPPAGELYFHDVADDGTVVGSSGGQACVRFASDGVVRDLRSWLVANGADVPPNHVLISATSISADGSTVVGTWTSDGFFYGVWVARISPPTGIWDSGEETPGRLTLEGVYPNPFNPTLKVRFSLEAGGDVAIDVFDAQGRRVRNLNAGFLGAGTHEVVWDGADDRGRTVASGLYLVELRGAGERHTAKAVLGK